MKNFAFVTITTLLLLLGIETVFFIVNQRNKIELPFLIAGSQETFLDVIPQFDESHALLGWKASDDKLQAKTHYQLRQQTPYLVTSNFSASNGITILITGGSTTDIYLNEMNWPVELVKLLDQKGIQAEIYVGAVGGYNTGQELLYLFEKGLGIEPDLHISYSGANEALASYISDHELNLYQRTNAPSLFMPNTISVLGSEKHQISERKIFNHAQFWQQNMKSMQGLSKEFGYDFIGLIQPVLKGERSDEALLVEKYDYFFNTYKSYYPELLKISEEKEFYYINDLSMIFDSFDKTPFVDDCHLKPEAQLVVAQNVFSIVENHFRHNSFEE